MKKTYILPADEYKKICSEISTHYYDFYEKKFLCIHNSHSIDGRHMLYYFENYGYGNYNIYLRTECKD